MKFNKNEIKYLAFAIGFCIVWFMFLLPYFIDKFDGNYFAQFLLFNIGLVIFLQVFLKAVVLKTKIKDIIGLVLVFVTLDSLTPPYVLSNTGQIYDGMLLAKSSSDYFIAMIGMNFGITGQFLYIWTYIIAPVMILILAAILLKDFVKKI